ncbi:MAG: dihydropteroate synthase [Planctomycetaceae bacterium]
MNVPSDPRGAAQSGSTCAPVARFPWHAARRPIAQSAAPLLMGIVNVTPDSFSDGGLFNDPSAAVDHALRLAADGADIIDVGGESTRPGAAPVPLDDELRRVVPVIERLAGQSSVCISIDTTKARVAKEALAAGARIVNDISGLQFDAAMVNLCAATGAGVICMHIQGTPETMQHAPQYADVVPDVCRFLAARLAELERRGISRDHVVLDPGIGFGKTAGHNLELLSHVATLRALGRPVCVGHSRKGFIKKLLGREVDERLFATIGVAVACAVQGADVLRIHDVRAVRDAILACQAVLSDRQVAN